MNQQHSRSSRVTGVLLVLLLCCIAGGVFYILKAERLNDELIASKYENVGLNNDLEIANLKHEQAQRDLEFTEQVLRAEDSKLASFKQQVRDQDGRVKEILNLIAADKERHAELKGKYEALTKQNEEQKKLIADQEKQIKRLRRNVRKLKTENKDFKEQIGNLRLKLKQKDADVDALKEQLNELRGNIEMRETEIEDLRKKSTEDWKWIPATP